jgi:hypothetical protein
MVCSMVVCLVEMLCLVFLGKYISSVSQSSQVVNRDWDQGVIAFGDRGDCVNLCSCRNVVLPWHFSFMDVRCDLLANIARRLMSIRRSLNPGGAVNEGGWGVAMSSSRSFATMLGKSGTTSWPRHYNPDCLEQGWSVTFQALSSMDPIAASHFPHAACPGP